jgi:hypothetical protein
MTTTANKPSDIILKFLEEIVELWNNGRYQKVTEQCVALLKRKKTIENLNLTVPLQRILLQAFIHQDQYDKVSEWDSSTTAKREGCNDLVLYAKYRTEEYESVSKQSAAAITDDDNDDNDNNNNASMHRNLHAQSEFQLNRTEDALVAYQDLISVIDDDDVESKMEVLTNALAVIAASACTPTVKLGSKNDDTTYKFWTDEAEMILSQEDDDIDLYTDLATNLGSIQFLTDLSGVATENWLEVAANQKNDDGQVEQINLLWSKHFWYKDVEDVRYDVAAAAPVTNSKINSSTKHNQLSVSQSVAKVNQSLMDDNLSRLPPQPHPKWNMLQLRMYWYDRAILQLRAEKYVECHDSCQSLKKTLSSSAASGGKKKKKNSNKGAGSSNNNNDASSSSSPTILWWESRADVILAYAQQAQSKYKDASARLNESLDSIKAASSSSPSLVIDHATAHVQLHRFVLEQQQNKKGQQRQQRELLKVLKSLPESIQSRPAVQLTMDDLESTVVDSSDEVGNKTTKNTPKSPLEEADILFGQAQYDDACKLYEGALSSSSKNSSTVDSQLRYVQALAMSGQHEASQALWQSLESTLLQEEKSTSMKLPVAHLPNGGSLENKSLPRSAGSTKSTSISKKLEANNNAAGNQNDDEADKPSREKILRRRARKREEYLQELEKKGDYNPDRPTKPDPERWIPKHERSRSRRGRNNSNKGNNRSAQGGGSNKDAERLGLDAAARRAGKVPVSSAPSTATMKVSSGGGKGRRRR